MTIDFAPAVPPAAITSHQATHVGFERNLGVRSAVGLLVHPFATRDAALDVIFRSVERQARLAGCGPVRLEASR